MTKKMPDLSVLIPARNERWLSRTVEDVVAHAKGDTEVIVVLDGAWPEPGYELVQRDNVQVIYLPQSIGQRAAVNLAARVSTAQYVMKLDAHCAVAEGFDVTLVESAKELGPDATQIPAQHNLHVFDWVCDECGHRQYQGPTPASCVGCGRPGMRMDVVWNAVRRRTEFWRFDSDLKFNYWGAYQERPESQGEIVDVMTSLGACFFIARERFWRLGGLDEAHGSWGQFGVEVACKSWLSGGRHVVNKRTWFSHLFRTQGGDFGFPYQLARSTQEASREYSRNLWLKNAWPGQVRPLRWLVEKFSPVPGWSQEQVDALPDLIRMQAVRTRRVSKGLVYYTDNQCPEPIAWTVREQLQRVAPGPIVSVSLQPIDFGQNVVPFQCNECGLIKWARASDGAWWNDHLHGSEYQPEMYKPLERGYLTMFKQILAGLEALDTDIAFLVEHDVLYHASHFEAEPKPGTYLYNQHVWKVDAKSGRALHYCCSQTSGLCADRQLLIDHYRTRVAYVEAHGYSRNNGFEPGTRHVRHGGFDDLPAETWMSDVPNVDIRHGHNLTPSRWRKDQFRNQKYTEGWTEADAVPGWGVTIGRFGAFLDEVHQRSGVDDDATIHGALHEDRRGLCATAG